MKHLLARLTLVPAFVLCFAACQKTHANATLAETEKHLAELQAKGEIVLPVYVVKPEAKK